ncbi:hypothetical protein [Microscilla marina]|uniref:Uncharacterized protein n=1 Tax=Microscilla marina ATCC 23134 TaxID=313606 RepID=A1ZL60_MICM2|nr:hypothetical protein [Microscilla marina]EAY29026.1 hypothetical protein M23134_00180 [Microscilla marina ATCC 23134]
MVPQIFKNLLQLVGGGAMVMVIIAIILYLLQVIPTKAVTGFIVWTLGGASTGALLGLVYSHIFNK